MSAIRFLNKSKSEVHEKFSEKKFVKLVKIVKPILKTIWRKHRTNAVTPSTCNYDVVESFQNDINESEPLQLDFEFLDGTEDRESVENFRNELLEKRMLEAKLRSDDGEDGRRAAAGGKSRWTTSPVSDADIWERAAGHVTWGQRAEQQVPVPAVI